jgi:hypothetical protein
VKDPHSFRIGGRVLENSASNEIYKKNVENKECYKYALIPKKISFQWHSEETI